MSMTSPSPSPTPVPPASGPTSSIPPSKALTFSDEALRYARTRLEQRGTPDAAVRLGVKGGGCSGFSYVIEFSDDPPRRRDTVYEFDGVRFYVDKKSLAFLAGTQLDYKKTMMFSGFEFVNPREATRCGCGHSFTVK